MYNMNVRAVYEWDERKREINLKKHGLDFQDAWLVYENPEKLTLPAEYSAEERWLDVAVVETRGLSLGLVYNIRNNKIRIISFRAASRKERKQYERAKAQRKYGAGESD